MPTAWPDHPRTRLDDLLDRRKTEVFDEPEPHVHFHEHDGSRHAHRHSHDKDWEHAHSALT